MTLKDLERLKAEGKIRGWVDPKGEGSNLSAPKKSKYNNKKVELDGIVFDSVKESKRYMELRFLLKAGEIEDLQVHVPFDLIVEGEKVAVYEADFTYKRNGELMVEDVKSAFTRRIATYRLKKKLMKSIYNIEIVEV